MPTRHREGLSKSNPFRRRHDFNQQLRLGPDPRDRPARPGLRHWRDAILAYFTTHRGSTGGTGPVNGIIELRRRLASGFRNRDNCRLRMHLAASALTP